MSHPHRRKSEWKRQTAIISRWLHIYLSMVSFAILFFFAVTGITLNHQDWFSGVARTVQMRGKVDQKWVKTADPKAVAKLELVEFLRNRHGVKSALSDFRVDDSQIAAQRSGHREGVGLDHRRLSSPDDAGFSDGTGADLFPAKTAAFGIACGGDRGTSLPVGVLDLGPVEGTTH
jgi:hypothetical protein